MAMITNDIATNFAVHSLVRVNNVPAKSSALLHRTAELYIYIKSSDDIKLFGSVPYESKGWINIYKDRTSCERMNNRIINDCKFSNITIKGRNRNLFMMIVIGINIHLDTFDKVTKL